VRARLATRLAADRFVLEMELDQGVNRQIRRMCRDLDLTVLKLARVAQGPLTLGALPAGKCRELAASELAALRRSVGLSPSAAGQNGKRPGHAPDTGPTRPQK
jgi:23S rRNA pseudouridine2605 synthase